MNVSWERRGQTGRAWRHRNGSGPPADEGPAPDESPLAARALGALYLAGATIGLVSLLLPHSAKADDAGLYSNVGLAYLGGLALLVCARRIPGWALHVAVVAGTLLITRAVLLSGERVSFYSVWYIWVGLYAFYFFSRAGAAAHVTLVSGLYAVSLVTASASSPIARWLTTVATLMVAGVFIDTLVRRARRDAGASAASARRMTRVAGVAHELAGLSESSARPAMCSAAARVTGAAGAALWEPSPDGAGLLLTAYAGHSPTQREIAFAGPPAGAPQAFTSGETVTDRASTETRQLAPEFSGLDAGPVICLWQPILRDKAPVAVLGLYWEDPTALVDDPSVSALTDLLAAEIAVTLVRIGLLARLEAVARTDELTGLPNRRAWQEALPREVSRASRSTGPLCVAMLDIDFFKDYNDEQGHQAGDRLLKELAGAWTNELRSSDILARYGGEEFALLLPTCSIDRAIDVVARLRAATPSGQTCSAGIACWDRTEPASELVERADRALYDAKRAGRDRTTCAASTQGSYSGVRDFARNRWPLRGSLADTRG